MLEYQWRKRIFHTQRPTPNFPYVAVRKSKPQGANTTTIRTQRGLSFSNYEKKFLQCYI